MIWQVLIAVTLVAFADSVGLVSARNNNGYYFSSQPVSFPQAWAYCKNAKMRFIYLPTAAQNQAVADALSALGSPPTTFWIGGIFLGNSSFGKWYWVDGPGDFYYLNWVKSPILGRAVDYCVAYSYNPATKEGVWINSSCSAAKYFICEN